MRTVVVTRHEHLITVLRERDLIEPTAEIIAHVTDKEQISGAHVIGILPLRLAQYAAMVSEPDMTVPPSLRGQELSLEDTRELVQGLLTFRVVPVNTATRA